MEEGLIILEGDVLEMQVPRMAPRLYATDVARYEDVQMTIAARALREAIDAFNKGTLVRVAARGVTITGFICEISPTVGAFGGDRADLKLRVTGTIRGAFNPRPMHVIDDPTHEVRPSHRAMVSWYLSTLGKKKETTVRSITKDHVKKNKFYVGSKSALERAWGHATVQGALEHASKLVDDSDGEDQFIVKIVRVVRRVKQPVKVEVVS